MADLPKHTESPPASTSTPQDVAPDASHADATSATPSPQKASEDTSGSLVTGPHVSPYAARDLPDSPSRYHRAGDADRAYLICQDAPDVQLSIERGLVVDDDTRRNYAKQTIFLDGVYDGPPFLDNEARQYSLDHHVGCLRPFTLATCEQAAVLLEQGIPLTEGTWQLYVNNPDLDAMLAAWLLMNHQELGRDKTILGDVMPFVRVEGTIDVHGFDKPLLSGLPSPVFALHKRHIDDLLQEERQLKEDERWNKTDWLAYGERLLSRLDRLLYPTGYLNALVEMTEIAQIPLGGEKIAVLCQSRQGIYAVETHLKRRYDKHLAVIVLDAGGGTFTLRQADPFHEKNLEAVYEILNKRDPNVTAMSPSDNATNALSAPADATAPSVATDDGETTDKRSPPDAAEDDMSTGNRWGGASDIGGSPRATGSALSGEDVLQCVGDVFSGGGWLRRVVRKITRIGHR
ncbi:MAG: hypothetical protein KAI47_14130 [Deltaproteobacteria bacterium]|nr:hypothetical protein [Deltaproteobacteria bacterium]